MIQTKTELLSLALALLDEAQHLERHAKYANQTGGADRAMSRAAALRLQSRRAAAQAHAMVA